VQNVKDTQLGDGWVWTPIKGDPVDLEGEE
jgi:hypothetical protein